MLYKPQFCCNCGEKIDRLEWNLLTSRRFCVVCTTENRAHEILPRLTVTAGALALMFGFGSLWTSSGSGRAEYKSTDNAVGIKSVLPPATAAQSIGPVVETRLDPLASNTQTAEQTQTGATLTAAGAKSADKYFCGALTKKGTPCSRKVKGKGLRCFQHEGKAEAPTSE